MAVERITKGQIGAVAINFCMFVFLLAGCGKKANQAEIAEPDTAIKSVSQEETEADVEENAGETIEPENKYYIAEDQDVDYDETEYGKIKQEQEAFTEQDGRNFFYYDMECFYFNETYPVVLNETLQSYYDSKKESYQHDSETYADESFKDAPSTPFDKLMFQRITYAGDDYVSLLFIDVDWGPAHPYSALDGVTIDCSTGEIADVDRFIDDSDEEIEEHIKAALGKDIVYDQETWDYYITDKEVVFFYSDPRFQEPVATERLR